MGSSGHDNIAFLFSRLTWPSLIVRERSCTSVAELLIDQEQGTSTLEYLKNWAKKQKLESVVVFALLVLLRAKILEQSFELPVLEEILAVIDKPSALSYLLLKELGYDDTPKPDWASMSLLDCPHDFEPSHFFSKYCTNYLPPIYKDRAYKIGKKYGLLFYEHWAFEWETILDSIGKKPSPEPLRFWGREENVHYDGVDLMLSDVYRSAYLRTLVWAIGERAFREEDATYFSLKTCPIDPSLWKINSLVRPQWWPSPKSSSEIIDTVTAETWKQVANFWDESQKTENKWLVAHASGRVCQADSVYDLEIRGVFQRCFGSNKPELKDVFNEATCNIPYVTKSIGLDGYVGRESIGEYIVSINDWGILPAACMVL